MDLLTKHGTHNNPVFKIVVAVLFIVFPIIGFVFGMQYQAAIDSIQIQNINTTIIPTPNATAPTSATPINVKESTPSSAVGENNETDLLKQYSKCLSNTSEHINNAIPLEVLNAIRKTNGKYSLPSQSSVSWFVSPTDEPRSLEGYKITAILNIKELDESRAYFIDKGFTVDSMNVGMATVKGSVGFYRGCVVCVDSREAVNYNNLEGDYYDKITCAILK